MDTIFISSRNSIWSRLHRAGTEATHEAEGAKTRGADASSIEFAHEPDPLYPTADGDAKERAPDDNGAAHEAASTETLCLSPGMLTSADEVSAD